MLLKDMLAAPKAGILGFCHCERILVVIHKNQVIHLIFQRIILDNIPLNSITASKTKLGVFQFDDSLIEQTFYLISDIVGTDKVAL